MRIVVIFVPGAKAALVSNFVDRVYSSPGPSTPEPSAHSSRPFAPAFATTIDRPARHAPAIGGASMTGSVKPPAPESGRAVGQTRSLIQR